MIVLPDPTFPGTPSLLGPIFEEAGTGQRQMREALFLTFNVNLGFFEARLLGPTRAAGAAVTVVADGSVFAPDPRSVRGAGHHYALGLAAMSGAFHPKLTVLAGPERALIGVGSGNLTIGGWHANHEVLTTIRASREDGVPTIVAEIVTFLRGLPTRVAISPLAVDGIGRTADELDRLVQEGHPIDTGHRLVTSVSESILDQLPEGVVDELELSAPFHDLAGAALDALVRRHHPRQITILAQPGQAVMEPDALRTVAAQQGCQLRFVQLDGEESQPTRYRHGKVLTALQDETPVWALVGSPNLSRSALLGHVPAGNCEVAVLAGTDRSLLPIPTVPVNDVASLSKVIGPSSSDDDSIATSGGARLLEARALDGCLEIVLSSPLSSDVPVEVSPYMASPEDFQELGIARAGDSTAAFTGTYSPGTRVRMGEQIQFLAFAEMVVTRLRVPGDVRPNHNSTVQELFTSDSAAAQWQSALTRLLLTHGQAPNVGGAAEASRDGASGVANWRTLADPDAWAAYSEDALYRLGMPIFQLAAGTAAPAGPVGASLSNAAPAWEDRFDDTSDAFEEGQTPESAEELSTFEDVTEQAPPLSQHQRSRLRKWLMSLVDLGPQLGPLEQIAITQLAIAGSSALIWDGTTGTNGWFNPLATSLEAMARDNWPPSTQSQASAVASIGLYRLRMALPPDERGSEAMRFGQIARRLAPLVGEADPEAVAGNLELLAGATLVPRSADDVITEVWDAITSGPDRAVLRVLGQLLPEMEAEWVGGRWLVLRGSSSNPLHTAALVLGHAFEFPQIAVGVMSDKGPWAAIVRTEHRITVLEGGRRPTTYKTYNTTDLPNPLGVLTNPELAQIARISTPPWTKPGTVDIEVLDALGIVANPHEYPLTSTGALT